MPTINIRWSDNTKELAENLKQGLNQIEATRAAAEKMAKALGGENLIRAAHNYVAAVQELGGANRLTASEQDRVNAVLEKAIAKYTALGQQAPAALLEIYEATKRAVVPVDQLAVETERLTKQLGGGAQSAQAYVAAVEKLGGASKLTATEQNQVNAVLTEAMAKYKALGQTAPAAMVALEQATRKAVVPVDQLAVDTERLSKQLGGSAMGQAHAYVAAVQQLGGASKLTAAEQRTVNAAVTEAIAKYKALGQTAPAVMIALAEATKKTEAPTVGLASSLSAAGKQALTMATGFFTAQAAIAAVRSGVSAFESEVENLVMHGSAVSDVTANFERLTSQAGRLGSTLLTELRNGTHATIDDFELMKLANQDLAAGLRLSDQQFGTLAKGAFALAQATGTDVKTALDTMNDAMLTGRTRALAMLTGKIDLTAAEEKFAKSIGSTAEHLNEEGKLEAARMAILDGVSAATERLGDQVDGLDENVAQVQVTWANFHNELAKTVAESPVLEAAFNGVKDAIAGAVGADQQALVKAVAERIDDATIALMDLAHVGVEAGTFLAVEAIAVAKVYGDVVQVLSLVAMSFKAASLAAAEFLSIGGNVGPLKDDVGRIKQEMFDLKIAIRERGKALQEDDAAQESVRQSGQKLTETLNNLQTKMSAARDTAAAFVGPLQQTAAAHTEAAAAADQHAQYTQQTKEEIAKAAAELKKSAAITAEAASSMNDLSGAQVEAIRYYKEQQTSVADTAHQLKIYEQQVRQVIAADTDALKAKKEQSDFDKRVAKEQSESLKEMSGEVLSNLRVQTAAEKEHWTAVAKLTMTGVQFDLAQVDQWELEEKAKLDQRALNHKAAEAAIVQAAQDRRDEIRRLAEFEDVKIRYEFVGPTEGGPASGPTTGQKIIKGIGDAVRDIPATLIKAFEGGGDFMGAMKAIGVQIADAIVSPILDGIETASTKMKALAAGLAGAMAGIATLMSGGSGKKAVGASAVAGAGVASTAIVSGATIGAGIALGVATAGIGAAVVAAIVLARHIHKSEAEKLGQDIGRDIGVQVPKEMLKAWEKESKQFGRQATEILHLKDLITLAGGLNANNFGMFAGKLRDVFSMIETHQLTVAQGAKIIDDNWQDMLAAGTDSFGFIDQRLKEIIDLNQRFGTNSKEVAEFLKQQADVAVSASNDVIASIAPIVKGWQEIHDRVEAANKAWDEAKKKGDMSAMIKADKEWAAANKELTELTKAHKQELEDLGVVALATFSAAIASGKSFAEALEAAGPGLQTLVDGFKALNIETDNAALKALMFQSQMLANNPALVKGVSSLGQAFAALSNMGLLNVDTFSAMQRTGAQMYQRLQAGAAAVGGTTRDALIPMQDYLHQAQKAAEELGVPLDENTQMLIDQSKELGIWKDAGKSATEKVTDAMTALVDKVQELINTLLGIPKEVKTSIIVDTKHTGDGPPPTGSTDPQDYSGDWTYRHPGEAPEYDADMVSTAHTGAMVTPAGIERFHDGTERVGSFGVLRNDEVPAILQVGEAVLNRGAVVTLGEKTIAALNHGESGADVTQQSARVVGSIGRVAGSGAGEISTEPVSGRGGSLPSSSPALDALLSKTRDAMNAVDQERSALMGRLLSGPERQRSDELDRQWDALKRQLVAQKAAVQASTGASTGESAAQQPRITDSTSAAAPVIAGTRAVIDQQDKLIVAAAKDASAEATSQTDKAWRDQGPIMVEATRKTVDEILAELRARFGGLHLDAVHIPIVPDTGELDGLGRVPPGGASSQFLIGDTGDSGSVRVINAPAVPTMPAFRPISTGLIPAMPTPGAIAMNAVQQDMRRPAIAAQSDSAEAVAPTTIHNTYNVKIDATDAPSFQELVRKHGVPVVIDQIQFDKGGAKVAMRNAIR